MNLVDRAKNMIVSPKSEWSVVASEEPNIQQILFSYIFPLALIPAIASIIGWGVVGSVVKSMSWGIAMGLVQFFSAFITIFVAAFVINALASNFGSENNLGRAVQLVGYSYTPVLIGGVLNIIPFLSWLGILFGLYGLYIMYIGFPHTMKTPQDKVAIYFIISIVVMIIVYWLIALILTSIFVAIFGLSMISLMHMG